ncbi:hypothetical protein D1007_13798 [Hordeum vulgare]|nr:hypothetical protein D1007_13798 [Hordeum vulgare]
MSYYDFDTDFQIPIYGTQDPEEYLEQERKMDTDLKLLQVPSEDQVKYTTRNFHEYALTWWLYTPSKSFEMIWSKMKKAMRQEFVPCTYTEHLQLLLENTIQGSKPLGEYFMEMNKALRRAGVDDPIWMKFHFMMGWNNDIAKTISTNTYKSLDDLYFGSLKEEQELKAKDGVVMRTTTDPLMEHALEASDKVVSKDDACIFGGESDAVPSSAFILDDGDDKIEHGIFPSTTAIS